MFPGFMLKPGPSLRERVRRALKNEGPARGQLTIAQRILAPESSLAEYQAVYRALRELIADGTVIEKRDDECGAPSYIYTVKS